MYRINEQGTKNLRIIKNNYYSKKMEITPNYVSAILNNGQKCSALIAKSFISIYMKLPLDDEQISEKLKEYFDMVA